MKVKEWEFETLFPNEALMGSITTGEYLDHVKKHGGHKDLQPYESQKGSKRHILLSSHGKGPVYKNAVSEISSNYDKQKVDKIIKLLKPLKLKNTDTLVLCICNVTDNMADYIISQLNNVRLIYGNGEVMHADLLPDGKYKLYGSMEGSKLVLKDKSVNKHYKHELKELIIDPTPERKRQIEESGIPVPEFPESNIGNILEKEAITDEEMQELIRSGAVSTVPPGMIPPPPPGMPQGMMPSGGSTLTNEEIRELIQSGALTAEEFQEMFSGGDMGSVYPPPGMPQGRIPQGMMPPPTPGTSSGMPQGMMPSGGSTLANKDVRELIQSGALTDEEMQELIRRGDMGYVPPPPPGPPLGPPSGMPQGMMPSGGATMTNAEMQELIRNGAMSTVTPRRMFLGGFSRMQQASEATPKKAPKNNRSFR